MFNVVVVFMPLSLYAVVVVLLPPYICRSRCVSVVVVVCLTLSLFICRYRCIHVVVVVSMSLYLGRVVYVVVVVFM